MKYIVDKMGRKKDVIISVKKYNQMLRDLHDLSIVAERRDEEEIPFDVLKDKFLKENV